MKFETGFGQSRLTRLMRTILQDGVLYFFVMVTFHIVMLFFAFFVRSPSARRKVFPDSSGIPQAFRSTFCAGCDHSVRISPFPSGLVANPGLPAWYL